MSSTLNARITEFLASRFVLRENALWRVMGLLRPFKHRVILANLCLALASVMASLTFISLKPLASMTLGNRPPASAPAQIETAPGVSAASGGSGSAELGPGDALKQFRQRIDGFAARHPSLRGVATPLGRGVESLGGWMLADSKRFILAWTLFVIVVLAIQGFFQFTGQLMMSRTSIRVTSDLMRRLYANVLRQEMGFFDRTSTGNLLNTCYREVFDLRSIINFLASQRVLLPVQMLILFGALLIISVNYSLLLLAMMPIVIVPTTLLTRRLKASLKRELEGVAMPLSIMSEAFHGIRAIKTFGAEPLEGQYLDPSIDDYVAVTERRRTAEAIIEPVVDLLNMFVLLLVFVAACLMFPSELGNTGTLFVFILATTRFYKPMRTIMTMNIKLQRAAGVSRRIFTLLDRQPEIVEAGDPRPFPREWRELRFDDVSLDYRIMRRGEEQLRRALRHVKFTIRRGEAVALIGPNGAGKSSIVNLLCRLYEPTGGRILIGDTALSEIRLAEVREKICLITQHPILFNRSVAENIAFGLPGVTRERIEAAARATRAHDFIMSLPDGYETEIGEQGKLLSGGERQKLVLARAFVRQPEIMIMDEPTTGLDHETQHELLELVAMMHRQGLTIIYITHDRSHLPRFQRVLRMTPQRRVKEYRRAAAGAVAVASTEGSGAPAEVASAPAERPVDAAPEPRTAVQ